MSTATAATDMSSENWDEDFGGDLRITDEISKVHEKLNGHLALVRRFHGQTNDLDRILTDLHGLAAEDLLRDNTVLQALDLVALANEDHSLCRVFSTRLGLLYKQQVSGFPTLKFLAKKLDSDKENMYKEHKEAIENATISVDIDTLPALCEHTDSVLKNLRMSGLVEESRTQSGLRSGQQYVGDASRDSPISGENNDTEEGDVSVSSSVWSDI